MRHEWMVVMTAAALGAMGPQQTGSASAEPPPVSTAAASADSMPTNTQSTYPAHKRKAKPPVKMDRAEAAPPASPADPDPVPKKPKN